MATVGLFTIEYLARIWVSENRLRFISSYWGIVDLIAILPFYLRLGLDLRVIRTLRLLRLFRVLKLTRYSRAVQRFHRALVIAREELVLFGATALILLYLSAVGIYYCENEAQPEQFSSVFACLWWSVTTLTTVGYGVMYPVTGGGKFFTFFVLVLGLGVVAVPAGLIGTALSTARRESCEEQQGAASGEK